MIPHDAPADMKTGPASQTLNCFSVDVEGFVESNLQSFSIDTQFIDRAKENNEIERNISALLGLLDDLRTKGTFFFLGRIARDIPTVVRQVAAAGHEIACHGYEHVRVFDLSREEFRRQMTSSRHHLEDLSGTRVCGFRAPDFSIVESSLWALDILKEVGFLYDSSIYPFGFHDVYGISGADRFIYRHSNGLIEFPLPTVDFLGRRIPFGGGGYFRLYPLMLTKAFISRMNREGHPCMFYIHPYEMGPAIPRITGLPWHRAIRHYHNWSNGRRRFEQIARRFAFGPAIDILREKGLIEV